LFPELWLVEHFTGCAEIAIGARFASPHWHGRSMDIRLSGVTGMVAMGLLLCATGKLQAQQDKPTAAQGMNNPSDREIMQKIRKSLTDDPDLSTYAHNVKVISHHGKVTLRGPVRSHDEKESVEQKAAQVAGAGNVTSELTIEAERSKKSNQ
jgi:osmotically-inducible protein OsmY